MSNPNVAPRALHEQSYAPPIRRRGGLRAREMRMVWAFVVPALVSYAIFFFRQFMHSIPDDLIHAARIDGLGEWGIFNRIILPLSGAALATMAAFYFMWNWNDFFWPLIVISESSKMMLPNALASLVAERGNDFPLVNAGATIAIVPILILFLFVQRYVVQGVALTGLK